MLEVTRAPFLFPTLTVCGVSLHCSGMPVALPCHLLVEESVSSQRDLFPASSGARYGSRLQLSEGTTFALKRFL